MATKTKHGYRKAEGSYVWLGVDPRPKDMDRKQVGIGILKRIEWRGSALTGVITGLSDDGTRMGKERPYRLDLLKPCSREEYLAEEHRRLRSSGNIPGPKELEFRDSSMVSS